MLLRMFLNICVLRARPQDLPASFALFRISLFVYFTANMVVLFDGVSLARALLAAIVDTLLLVALAHSALLLRQHGERMWQTLSALAGCGAFVSIVAWVATSLALRAVAPEVAEMNAAALAELSPAQVQLIMLVWFPCLAWFVLVFGHILRHSLDVPMFVGVVFAMLYVIVSTAVSRSLIGGPESNG